MNPFKSPVFWFVLLPLSCVFAALLPDASPSPVVPVRVDPVQVVAVVDAGPEGPPPLTPAQEARAVMLSRICAHEAMYLSREWSTPPPDCWAIHSVITNRARDLGLSWEGAAHAYSRCALVPCLGDENPWAAGLQADAREPAGWPSSVVAWGYRARGRYVRLLDYARRIVAGRVEPECNANPDHWGSRSRALPDWERAQRAIAAGRWAPVDCPGSLNAFYRVRRRH